MYVCFERVCLTYIPCPLLATVSDAFLESTERWLCCVCQGSARDVAFRPFGLGNLFPGCCMRSQHFGYQAASSERRWVKMRRNLKLHFGLDQKGPYVLTFFSQIP